MKKKSKRKNEAPKKTLEPGNESLVDGEIKTNADESEQRRDKSRSSSRQRRSLSSLFKRSGEERKQSGSDVGDISNVDRTDQSQNSGSVEYRTKPREHLRHMTVREALKESRSRGRSPHRSTVKLEKLILDGKKEAERASLSSSLPHLLDQFPDKVTDDTEKQKSKLNSNVATLPRSRKPRYRSEENSKSNIAENNYSDFKNEDSTLPLDKRKYIINKRNRSETFDSADDAIGKSRLPTHSIHDLSPFSSVSEQEQRRRDSLRQFLQLRDTAPSRSSSSLSPGRTSEPHSPVEDNTPVFSPSPFESRQSAFDVVTPSDTTGLRSKSRSHSDDNRQRIDSTRKNRFVSSDQSHGDQGMGESADRNERDEQNIHNKAQYERQHSNASGKSMSRRSSYVSPRRFTRSKSSTGSVKSTASVPGEVKEGRYQRQFSRPNEHKKDSKPNLHSQTSKLSSKDTNEENTSRADLRGTLKINYTNDFEDSTSKIIEDIIQLNNTDESLQNLRVNKPSQLVFNPEIKRPTPIKEPIHIIKPHENPNLQQDANVPKQISKISTKSEEDPRQNEYDIISNKPEPLASLTGVKTNDENTKINDVLSSSLKKGEDGRYPLTAVTNKKNNELESHPSRLSENLFEPIKDSPEQEPVSLDEVFNFTLSAPLASIRPVHPTNNDTATGKELESVALTTQVSETSVNDQEVKAKSNDKSQKDKKSKKASKRIKQKESKKKNKKDKNKEKQAKDMEDKRDNENKPLEKMSEDQKKEKTESSQNDKQTPSTSAEDAIHNNSARKEINKKESFKKESSQNSAQKEEHVSKSTKEEDARGKKKSLKKDEIKASKIKNKMSMKKQAKSEASEFTKNSLVKSGRSSSLCDIKDACDTRNHDKVRFKRSKSVIAKRSKDHKLIDVTNDDEIQPAPLNQETERKEKLTEKEEKVEESRPQVKLSLSAIIALKSGLAKMRKAKEKEAQEKAKSSEKNIEDDTGNSNKEDKANDDTETSDQNVAKVFYENEVNNSMGKIPEGNDVVDNELMLINSDVKDPLYDRKIHFVYNDDTISEEELIKQRQRNTRLTGRRQSKVRQRQKKVIHCCKKFVAFLFSHIGLCSLVVAYCILGGIIFKELEGDKELGDKREMMKKRAMYRDTIFDLSVHNIVTKGNKEEFKKEVERILIEYADEIYDRVTEGGWDGKDASTAPEQWSFSSALLYAITVMTTIGYGHVAPKTKLGRIVTIGYAVLGIPLTLLCLTNIGDVMAHGFRVLYNRFCCGLCCILFRPARRKKLDPEKGLPMEERMVVLDGDKSPENNNVPTHVCLLLMTGYIMLGTLLFAEWEGWDAVTGTYFCFITLSTIGFGDVVPGIASDKWDKNEKLVLCALYLVFGLSLIAMCFNLVQEDVKAKCKNLGQKLGIIDKPSAP